MRRMILLALGLGIIGTAAGCCHVAGVCDCDGPGGCNCGGSPTAALEAVAQPAPYGGPIVAPATHGEPIPAPRPLGNGVELK